MKLLFKASLPLRHKIILGKYKFILPKDRNPFIFQSQFILTFKVHEHKFD